MNIFVSKYIWILNPYVTVTYNSFTYEFFFVCNYVLPIFLVVSIDNLDEQCSIAISLKLNRVHITCTDLSGMLPTPNEVN